MEESSERGQQRTRRIHQNPFRAGDHKGYHGGGSQRFTQYNIPEEYQPTRRTSQSNINLNLDCVTNREQLIEETDNTIWETEKNCILDNTNENIMSLSKTNPNSIYIKGYFYFKGYKKYSLDMYVDTGASMCTANKLVIPEDDGYLLPNKEQLLQRIGGKNYYSSFDCKSGFWQVRLTESSIELTAFTCPQGHFEWIVNGLQT